MPHTMKTQIKQNKLKYIIRKCTDKPRNRNISKDSIRQICSDRLREMDI
jgi:hypothetical protein